MTPGDGTLRVATWNCCGGGKGDLPVLVERLQPGVAVVPEYGTHPVPAELFGPRVLSAGKVGWKCLAVVAFGPWQATPAVLEGPYPHNVFPVEVDGPRPFRLLAVWGPTPASEEHPVVEFVRRYPAWFEESVVVAGDFNTSGIERWRNYRPGGNHYVVLDALEGCRLRSAYHHFWKVEQGQERHPTFWMNRHADKPFHIDHIFAPEAWPVRSVTVGTFDDWKGHSDHAMVAEFG